MKEERVSNPKRKKGRRRNVAKEGPKRKSFLKRIMKRKPPGVKLKGFGKNFNVREAK